MFIQFVLFSPKPQFFGHNGEQSRSSLESAVSSLSDFYSGRFLEL